MGCASFLFPMSTRTDFESFFLKTFPEVIPTSDIICPPDQCLGRFLFFEFCNFESVRFEG